MYIPTGVNGIGRRLNKLGYRSYQEYLNGKHWKQFRSRFYKEGKRVRKMIEKFGRPVCEFCESAEKLNLHHWTYKRLGNEGPGDIMLVCNACHQIIHSVAKLFYSNNLHRASHLVKRVFLKKGYRSSLMITKIQFREIREFIKIQRSK